MGERLRIDTEVTIIIERIDQDMRQFALVFVHRLLIDLLMQRVTHTLRRLPDLLALAETIRRIVAPRCGEHRLPAVIPRLFPLLALGHLQRLILGRRIVLRGGIEIHLKHRVGFERGFEIVLQLHAVHRQHFEALGQLRCERQPLSELMGELGFH